MSVKPAVIKVHRERPVASAAGKQYETARCVETRGAQAGFFKQLAELVAGVGKFVVCHTQILTDRGATRLTRSMQISSPRWDHLHAISVARSRDILCVSKRIRGAFFVERRRAGDVASSIVRGRSCPYRTTPTTSPTRLTNRIFKDRRLNVNNAALDKLNYEFWHYRQGDARCGGLVRSRITSRPCEDSKRTAAMPAKRRLPRRARSGCSSNYCARDPCDSRRTVGFIPKRIARSNAICNICARSERQAAFGSRRSRRKSEPNCSAWMRNCVRSAGARRCSGS